MSASEAAPVTHTQSEWDALQAPCNMRGVRAQDVTEFLNNSPDFSSATPMLLAFADLMEHRSSFLRMKGVEPDALVDTFRSTQRNSLALNLFRCLPPACPPKAGRQAPSLQSPENSDGFQEGEAEPLWYVVDVLTQRQLQSKQSEEEPRPGKAGYAFGEDAEALWHEFWTNYRNKKASEPVVTNAQLRAGLGGAAPKMAPTMESLVPPSSAPGSARGWKKPSGGNPLRATRQNYVMGPRTAGLAALVMSDAPPPGSAASSRPNTRGGNAAVAGRIMQEMQLFEEQWSSMPLPSGSSDSGESDEASSPRGASRSMSPTSPRSRAQQPPTPRGAVQLLAMSPAFGERDTVRSATPRERAAPQARRGSTRACVIRGAVPRANGPLSARDGKLRADGEVSLLASDINAERRGAMFRAALPHLRLQEGKEHRNRYCFKGFEDYKQRKELLCEVPPSKKKPQPYRTGLSIDRMPPESGETALPPSAFVLAKAREKDRLYAEETLKDMAGRSQHQWSRAVREYMEVRKTRERPDLEERPRPLSPRGRSSPTTANFQRPWSREGTAPKSRGGLSAADAHLTPINRFAKVCLRSGLHPQPKSVRFLVSLPPKLDIRGAGYSDEDLLALAAALPYQGGIEAIDMGENSRLNDSSACAMLSVLAKRHARDMRMLVLDHCGHLGKETISMCTRLMQTDFHELQHLDVSGVTIAMHEYGELASALEVHPQIRTVHLAKTGLGFFSKSLTAQVIRSIVANKRILELELGWNSLSLSAFEVLGKGVVENQHITTLGLASTGPCPDPEAGGSPLLVFLEQLNGDGSLTSLDISSNVLDGSAPLLLEYSLRRHPRLEFLDISRNPLGPDGMRSLLRILAHPECTEFTKIRANECGGGQTVGDCNSFFDADPSGRYTLNMANPTQRALLQLLLFRLTERPPPTALSTFFRDAVLTQAGKENPFNFDGLKRHKGGGWQVPQSGDLHFELSASSVVLCPEDDGASPSQVVERITRRARVHLNRERKALAVLTFIKSMSDESSRTACLDALSRDFVLTPEQVKALCHTESKHVNCGHDPAGTCCMLLAGIFEASHVRQAASCTVTFSDLLRITRSGRWLLSLNLENPTGHYDLVLSEPMDRSTGERLLLLNRWQFHVWKAAGLFDITQHENGKNFRNEAISGRSFIWKAEEWHLPCGGATLSFDYVPLCRPPKDAQRLPREKWEEIMRLIKRVLKHQGSREQQPRTPQRRRSFLERGPVVKRTFTNLEETPSVITAEDVLWALRAASSRFWLTCQQLRELLCLFHDTKLRADAVAYFFLRCIDWPVNGKLCRAKFHERDWVELRKRLGYINLFPYFQPECLSVSLDLSNYEQRRVMHTLVRLSNSENMRNIKKPRIDKNGSGVFEPFTAGIPLSWDQFDSLPHRGYITLTYMCSMEHVRLRARRRLAASVGGWTHLPEDNNKLQKIVLWWSVLDDVPHEVVRVLVFLVSNFKDLNEAFSSCDSNKDGMLNHKEWLKKLQALGCAAGARMTRDNPGPGGEAPVGPGTTADQEEVLTAVYRFLDTSNDGDISKKEFEIFGAIWRELSQSMWELKMKLLHSFGSLEEAWKTRQLTETDAMDYREFARLAGECQFDGPLKQMFYYLDQDNNDSIENAEWMRLEKARQLNPD